MTTILAVFQKIRNFFVSFSINSCQTTNVSTFPLIRWYLKWIGVGPMAKMIWIVSLSQIMWRHDESNLSPKNIVYIRSFLHQYLLESEYTFAHAAMIVYVRGSIYVIVRDSSKKGSWRQGNRRSFVISPSNHFRKKLYFHPRIHRQINHRLSMRFIMKFVSEGVVKYE